MGNTQSGARDLSNYCTTPECIEIANRVLSLMAPNYEDLDPCESWDQYACGGFIADNALRLNQGAIGPQVNQAFENSVTIKKILENEYKLYAAESTAALDEEAFAKLQTAYVSCLDEKAILEAGTAPVTEAIEAFLKVFPLAEDDYKNPTNLTESDYELTRAAYAYLAKMGISAFFMTTPIPDIDDAEHYLPAISQTPPVPLEAEGIATLFALTLPQSLNSSIEVLTKGVMELGTAFDAIYPGEGYLVPYREVFESTTFDNASKWLPALDIPGFIGDLSPSSAEIGKILWGWPEVATVANEILLSSPKASIQAYFIYQIVSTYISAINTKDLAAAVPPTAARWQTCIADLQKKVPFLASKVFLDKRYPDDVDTALSELVTKIHEGAEEDVADLAWATDASKAGFKEKINKLQPNVGYSHSSPNNRIAADVSDFYKTLNVTDTYFGFTANALKFNFDFGAAQLGTKPDREQWNYLLTSFGSAEEVNALYMGFENAIFIPYGMAQSNLFSPSAPGYIQYGGIGYIIAHEIIHSIDTNGRQTRPDGSLWNSLSEWLDEETLSAYSERTKCIIDQSSSYKVLINGTELVPQNGTDKLNEDLADSGGINVAYRAWKRLGKQDKDIPGLDKFTHEQLFYLANAQPWCGIVTSERNESYVDGSDHHSIPYARIDMMARNSKGFREAFKCPIKKPTCELF